MTKDDLKQQAMLGVAPPVGDGTGTAEMKRASNLGIERGPRNNNPEPRGPTVAEVLGHSATELRHETMVASGLSPAATPPSLGETLGNMAAKIGSAAVEIAYGPTTRAMARNGREDFLNTLWGANMNREAGDPATPTQTMVNQELGIVPEADEMKQVRGMRP